MQSISGVKFFGMALNLVNPAGYVAIENVNVVDLSANDYPVSRASLKLTRGRAREAPQKSRQVFLVAAA